MFYYHIKTGDFLLDDEFWGTGYSGAGTVYSQGRNNENMVMVKDRGPIPPGVYKIEKPAYTHPVEGPYVMNLIPQPGTSCFDRSGFHIHGNNARNDASHGCIIL